MPIIGSLPNNLTNGTTADATQVMANFNTIVNAVNNATTGAAPIPSVQSGSFTYAVDTGVVNAYIIPMSPSPASYTDGLQGRTKIANTNTSTAVTVKFGSLGTKSVVIDAAGTLPPIGSIIASMHYTFEYDSTQDKVILINPSSSTGSFTITLTGMSSATTGTVNFRIGSDGKSVQVWTTASITGTSNAATMTGTGVPASLSAATNHANQMVVEDSGSWFTGMWFGTNSTTWNWSKLITASAGFTTSGTKGLSVVTAGQLTFPSYTLD